MTGGGACKHGMYLARKVFRMQRNTAAKLEERVYRRMQKKVTKREAAAAKRATQEEAAQAKAAVREAKVAEKAAKKAPKSQQAPGGPTIAIGASSIYTAAATTEGTLHDVAN